jgi:hypothetical protein
MVSRAFSWTLVVSKRNHLLCQRSGPYFVLVEVVMNGYKFNRHIEFSYNFFLREKEVREWCSQQFGPENTSRWGFYIDGFNFNDEKDYVLFLLRWS